MATEWFYTSKGQKAGPVSSQELRRLAKNGHLLPTDLLWKEGMKEWLPASKAKNLFTDNSSGTSHDPVRQQQEATGPAKEQAERGSGQGSRRIDSPASRIQQTARLAMLTAEKTKLANVSLPAAYVALAKQLYESRLLEKQFPELFNDLDQLQKTIDKKQTSPARTAGGPSLSERAKNLATKAAELAKAKKAEVQALAVLARLGLAASSGNASESLPAELVANIVRLRECLVDLDAEISSIRQASTEQACPPERNISGTQGSSFWKPRLIVGSGVLAALLFSGFVAANYFRAKEAIRPGRTIFDAREVAHVVPQTDHGATVMEAITSLPGTQPRIADRLSKRRPTSRAPAIADDTDARPQLPQSSTETSGEPSGGRPREPTKGELQMADAALQALLNEQKLLPLSVDGPLGLLPHVPRLKEAVPLHKTPFATYDTGDRHITQLRIGVLPDRCVVNESLLSVPDLTAIALDPIKDRFDRLSINRIRQKYIASDGGRTLNERFGGNPDSDEFVGEIARGRICGERLVGLPNSILAVIQPGMTSLSFIDDNSQLMFWSLRGSGAELLDVHPPYGLPDKGQAWRLFDPWYVLDAHSWSNALVLFTSDQLQNPSDRKTLEIWQPTGQIGSMRLTKDITEEADEGPYCLSVCDRTGEAAVLYKSALRIIDLTSCRRTEMPLAVKSEVVFDDPAPFRDPKSHRVRWTSDGLYCIVQREAINPTGGDSVVLEVYNSGGTRISRLDKDRAAHLGDVSTDGKYVAVHRAFRPIPGVDSTFDEPEEVELLSLPGLEGLGKVYTCFAKHMVILDDGVVVTGGVTDETHNGLVAGGWTSQQINQLVGGHYVTFWDVQKGRPIRRVRDVDIDDLVCTRDGKLLLTARRAHNNDAATVCAWRIDGESDGDEWVDEFAAMRRQAVETEKGRRKRITLPASPVDQDTYDGLREGQCYYEIKEQVGGAGRMSASIVTRESTPMLVAVVEFDASGDAKAVYRLTFEAVARTGAQRVENDIKLVAKERVD